MYVMRHLALLSFMASAMAGLVKPRQTFTTPCGGAVCQNFALLQNAIITRKKGDPNPKCATAVAALCTTITGGAPGCNLATRTEVNTVVTNTNTQLTALQTSTQNAFNTLVGNAAGTTAGSINQALLTTNNNINAAATSVATSATAAAGLTNGVLTNNYQRRAITCAYTLSQNGGDVAPTCALALGSNPACNIVATGAGTAGACRVSVTSVCLAGEVAVSGACEPAAATLNTLQSYLTFSSPAQPQPVAAGNISNRGFQTVCAAESVAQAGKAELTSVVNCVTPPTVAATAQTAATVTAPTVTVGTVPPLVTPSCNA